MGRQFCSAAGACLARREKVGFGSLFVKKTVARQSNQPIEKKFAWFHLLKTGYAVFRNIQNIFWHTMKSLFFTNTAAFSSASFCCKFSLTHPSDVIVVKKCKILFKRDNNTRKMNPRSAYLVFCKLKSVCSPWWCFSRRFGLFVSNFFKLGQPERFLLPSMRMEFSQLKTTREQTCQQLRTLICSLKPFLFWTLFVGERFDVLVSTSNFHCQGRFGAKSGEEERTRQKFVHLVPVTNHGTTSCGI